MKVLLFGTTGMVGQGALQACLDDPEVERVVAVTRTPLETKHAKIEEILHKDFTDFSALKANLRGVDACFFCLGVTAVGKTEAEYTRVTYDITHAAGLAVAAARPNIPFIYVSGAGTDKTEKQGAMWARVKGRTENALLRLPLRACLFRPGFIQPVDGARSKTGWYRTFYAVAAPVAAVVKTLAPAAVNTTTDVGRAMLRVAKDPKAKGVFEARDIARLAHAT